VNNSLVIFLQSQGLLAPAQKYSYSLVSFPGFLFERYLRLSLLLVD
jgi:hypothetical protein